MARTIRFPMALLFGALLLGCPPNNKVQVGAVLPLTGYAGVYGQSIRQGLELAAEHLAKQPDFKYKIELKIEDSGSDPKRASQLLDQLLDGGAMAVIGGVTSAEALEMIQVADQHERLLLSPSASQPKLTGISKNFFRIFPSDLAEGTTMANYAWGSLKLKSVVILAKEEPYAKGVQTVFEENYRKAGGSVLEVIEFPTNTRDFDALVDRVITLNPEAVYVAAYADEIAAIVSELDRQRFQGYILTTSSFASREALAKLGKAAEGVFFTQISFDIESKDEKVRAFVSAFRTKYRVPPDLYAAHGYDALMVLAAAIKAEGPRPSSLWKGLRGLGDLTGATGSIAFTDQGDAKGKFPHIHRIHDGKVLDYQVEKEKEKEKIREELKRIEEERRKLQNRALSDENPN